jgi:hypothetical protein
MGRQLVDVDVKFISLVKKAANKEEVTIYKSADFDPTKTESEEIEKGAEQVDKTENEVKKSETPVQNEPTFEGFFKVKRAFSVVRLLNRSTLLRLAT